MSRPEYRSLIETSHRENEFIIADSLGRPVVNDAGEEILGAPVDSQSITMRELGKMWYGVNLGIGVMQLMHPEIGAAVDHTGRFWQNPYRRVAVSLDPIMAVVYADNPRQAGVRVLDFHKNIHGVDPKGRKFNALSKDAFYWAHDTFAYGVENAAENYNRLQFTHDDKERAHLESNTWYSYYSMPMNMVPADYEAKLEYRRSMLNDVLEMTPAAERALNLALERKPPRPENVPKPVWALAKLALLPVTEVITSLTIGELPAEIREKFDIPFTKSEEKVRDNMRTIVKAIDSTAPDPLKYLTVYNSLYRERGGKHKNWRDELIHSASQRAIHLAGDTVSKVNNFRSKLVA